MSINLTNPEVVPLSTIRDSLLRESKRLVQWGMKHGLITVRPFEASPQKEGKRPLIDLTRAESARPAPKPSQTPDQARAARPERGTQGAQ